jgi:hypothetical protein
MTILTMTLLDGSTERTREKRVTMVGAMVGLLHLLSRDGVVVVVATVSLPAPISRDTRDHRGVHL